MRVHETIGVENQCVTYLCVCVYVCVCARTRVDEWVCVLTSACAWAFGCGCTGASVSLRMSVLINPACNAQPCCHLRPLWLHNIFGHYLITDTIFETKLPNIKRVFWFSLQLLFETFLILRRINRDTVMNVKTFSCKVPAILVGY
jgi:hypothetical protein